jgi:signal transduction histidine kinase/ActR/RegA family two-component response regulator
MSPEKASRRIRLSTDSELEQFYLAAEENQRRRLKLTEAITAANMRFIESGSINQMASILLDTCLTVTNSPFGMFYELLSNGNASVQALSLASFDPVSEVESFRDIQYEIRRHGNFEMKLHPSIYFSAIDKNVTVVVNSPAHHDWIPCGCSLCSAPLTCFLGIPLRIGTEIVGLICLANKIGGYQEGEVVELEHYAQTCAMAIGIARAELDRKKAMEQLRQAQKMEAIGQLAGGIAHDFNNLLTVINGYSSLLLQKLEINTPMRKDVEQILNAGERATTLIKQLLAFGRRQILEPRQFNVNTFITSLHKILSRLIGENITLTTQLSGDIGLIKADPGQIEQIIMNLVINARDALERVGTITITTDNWVLDDSFVRQNQGAVPGDYVMISVKDSGMGMPKEIISRIFEPFFTTKQQGSGTGLGLATVYGIVKQSNGYIQVLSEVGIGSEFRIYFPRFFGEEQHPVIKKRSWIDEQSCPGLILIVEDEQNVLDLSAITLKSRGFDVLTASRPLEALKIFEHYDGKIDLLLSDVIMPDMTGPEMAKIMRATQPDLKLIFMSGYTDEQLKTSDFPGEQMDFIMKPYNPVDLVHTVNECFKNHKTASSMEKIHE